MRHEAPHDTLQKHRERQLRGHASEVHPDNPLLWVDLAEVDEEVGGLEPLCQESDQVHAWERKWPKMEYGVGGDVIGRGKKQGGDKINCWETPLQYVPQQCYIQPTPKKHRYIQLQINQASPWSRVIKGVLPFGHSSVEDAIHSQQRGSQMLHRTYSGSLTAPLPVGNGELGGPAPVVVRAQKTKYSTGGTSLMAT